MINPVINIVVKFCVFLFPCSSVKPNIQKTTKEIIYLVGLEKLNGYIMFHLVFVCLIN